MTDPPTCTLSQTHEYNHLLNNKIKTAIVAVAPLALLATSVTTFADEKTKDVKEYTVKAGDTLSHISEELYGTVQYVDEIVYVNDILNPDYIEVGQVLDLKEVKTVKVPIGFTTSFAMSQALAGGRAAATASAQTIAQEHAEAQAAQTQTYQAPATDYSSYGPGSVVLSNGNTAGEMGTYAAQEIARRTGTDAGTWEHIIARESNGQVNAYNPSGASGLFQTMPGWGSTATVEDQINSAINAYNAQGFSAWGY